MQIEQDYYKTLGVTPNASMAEIKEAYHKLAFRYHPDRNQMNLGSNEKMLEINKAYSALSDYLLRSEYHNSIEYRIAVPKFNIGSKVRVSSHYSPYKDRTGIVDKEPFKDNFRFWYMVKFESNGLATIGRFAEEQLYEVGFQRSNS